MFPSDKSASKCDSTIQGGEEKVAIFRNVSVAFWTDSKVVDDFTPEDRYIYLYCMTNPHTKLCGCYEVSMKQIAYETGYDTATVDMLLKRLENEHGVIRYNRKTKEMLILHWPKHNWSSSEKLDKRLLGEIREIKCDTFRRFLAESYNQRKSISATYDSHVDTQKNSEPSPAAQESDTPLKKRITKHKHGQYGWVQLTDEEYSRLLNDLGTEELERCIAYVDESAQSNGNKNKWKDWNLVIRKCSRNRWWLNNNGLARGISVNKRSAMDDLKDLHSSFKEG